MMSFVTLFVLVVAAVCALLVLRSLGTLELPESPPFPRRRRRVYRTRYADPGLAARESQAAPEHQTAPPDLVHRS